jgi:DHA1 family inner membrane transport protein
MTIGTLLGGWAADRSVRRAAHGSFAALLSGLAILLIAVTHPAGLVAGALLAALGGSGLGPIVQTRLMDVGRDGLTFGASLNHAAFNVANALGVSLGGLAIALGLGYVAPIWVGVALAAGGLGLTFVTFAIDRRRRVAGIALPYGTGTIPTYMISRR